MHCQAGSVQVQAQPVHGQGLLVLATTCCSKAWVWLRPEWNVELDANWCQVMVFCRCCAVGPQKRCGCSRRVAWGFGRLGCGLDEEVGRPEAERGRRGQGRAVGAPGVQAELVPWEVADDVSGREALLVVEAHGVVGEEDEDGVLGGMS